MVARGDLGVEMPLERVPGVQKYMTRSSRRAGKPVVVATQMLELMINSPVPTRAEVSDVATAIFEGADAVMLSAESAAGQFPVEAVATMNRIAEEVENDPLHRSIIQAQRADPEPTGADAIAAAARQIAETLELAALICWTFSGSTALRVARERPGPPTVAISPNVATARRLSLIWGVHCIVAEDAHDQDDMVERACRLAFKDGFARAGQRVIVVAGVPLGTPGATNMLRIAFVGAEARAPMLIASDFAGCGADQRSRPSTVSVSRLIRSGIRSMRGYSSTARRNAASARGSSPMSFRIMPSPAQAPKCRGSRVSTCAGRLIADV